MVPNQACLRKLQHGRRQASHLTSLCCFRNRSPTTTRDSSTLTGTRSYSNVRTRCYSTTTRIFCQIATALHGNCLAVARNDRTEGMRVKGERCRDCDPGFFGDFSVVDQAIFSNDRKKLSHFGHDAFFSDTKCPKAMSLQKKTA